MVDISAENLFKNKDKYGLCGICGYWVHKGQKRVMFAYWDNNTAVDSNPSSCVCCDSATEDEVFTQGGKPKLTPVFLAVSLFRKWE